MRVGGRTNVREFLDIVDGGLPALFGFEGALPCLYFSTNRGEVVHVASSRMKVMAEERSQD